MTKISKPQIIIEAKSIDREYLQDLFRFKDLFLFFAARDILIRYRQAFFGIAWALIRPLLTMAIFVLIFGKVAKLSSEEINYPLFVLAGMIPWQLFSAATLDACQCLINNAHLITKTYFPRLIIPASQIMIHLTDYLFSTIFLAIMYSFFSYFSFKLLFFPLFFFQLVTLCLGVGLWFSALTVKYRDFKILIPFTLQFGMFLSPIGYGTFVIPEHLQIFYFLNPMVGIIDGFRWSLFEISYPLMSVSIAFSSIISISLLISGFYYFRKMERFFGDQL